MAENKKDIKLRSEEVQEIMTMIPKWIIRWGISLIFIFIASGLLISWMIKYPDIIQGRATLHTEQTTIKLISKSSGEITLNIKDNSEINEGTLIASVKTNLSEDAKTYLKRKAKEIRSQFKSNVLKVNFDNDHLSFGSLQIDYSNLKKSVLEYQYFIETNTMSFEIQNLNEQIANHVKLKLYTSEQLNTKEKHMKLLNEKLESVQRLYEKGVISKAELLIEKERFAENEIEHNEINKRIIESSITITSLKKELHDIQTIFNKKQTEMSAQIESQLSFVENALNNWENSFEFKALSSGRLTYLIPLNQQQHVSVGQELFGVIPNDQQIVGHIIVNQQGYGKLKKGQKIRIKLDNYPSQEYGQLNGEIVSFSLIPRKGSYDVKFKLTNGLTTSFGKKVKFTPEMVGQAEIITEDHRLLSRIFSHFKELF